MAVTKKSVKASEKKNNFVVPVDLLKDYETQYGRVYLKHSRKFATFPELL